MRIFILQSNDCRVPRRDFTITIGEEFWKPSYVMHGSMEDMKFFPECERGECPGWVPATLLVTWGIIPSLIVENVLMSFIEMGTVHSGKKHSFNAQDDDGTATPSQVARVEEDPRANSEDINLYLGNYARIYQKGEVNVVLLWPTSLRREVNLLQSVQKTK